MSDEKRCEHGYPIDGLCQLCLGLRRAVDAGYLSPGNGPQPMSDEKPSPWHWDDDCRTLYAPLNEEDARAWHEFSGQPTQAGQMAPVLSICEDHGIAPAPKLAALIADAWQLPQLREENREMRDLLQKAVIGGCTRRQCGLDFNYWCGRCLPCKARVLLDGKKRTP